MNTLNQSARNIRKIVPSNDIASRSERSLENKQLRDLGPSEVCGISAGPLDSCAHFAGFCGTCGAPIGLVFATAGDSSYCVPCAQDLARAAGVKIGGGYPGELAAMLAKAVRS